MHVTDASGTVQTTDGVGVVRLSVRWQGLAAVEGERLVVDEPFASDFQPDRPLVIVAPDSYTVSETSVPPTENEGAVARWTAGSDLSGFETTFSPSESRATAPTPLVSMLALLALVGLGYAARRRS